MEYINYAFIEFIIGEVKWKSDRYFCASESASFPLVNAYHLGCVSVVNLTKVTHRKTSITATIAH